MIALNQRFLRLYANAHCITEAIYDRLEAVVYYDVHWSLDLNPRIRGQID